LAHVQAAKKRFTLRADGTGSSAACTKALKRKGDKSSSCMVMMIGKAFKLTQQQELIVFGESLFRKAK
jgi:hypothetical protein